MYNPRDPDRAGPSTHRSPIGDRHVQAMEIDGKSLHQAAERVVRDKVSAAVEEERWTEPVTCKDGVFQGRVVRFLLRCVQEPMSGRRKTEKDRRPLAPVPIVRLWARECKQGPGGQWVEDDLDISDLDPSCLICEVDISLPIERGPDAISDPTRTQGPIDGDSVPLPSPSVHSLAGNIANRPPLSTYQSNPGPSHDSIYPRHYLADEVPYTNFPALQHRSSWVADQHWDTRSAVQRAHPLPGDVSSRGEYPSQQSYRAAGGPEHTKGRSRKVNRDETGESEGEMMTNQREWKKQRLAQSRNLFGALHVAGVKVAAPDGQLGIWFLFTDLCVRLEGTYALSFRIFDISLVVPNIPPIPHFAQCESQSFKVYSPRSFPGLPKPTELSEHFIRQGFKLNTRKNERTAKTPSPPGSPTEDHAIGFDVAKASGPDMVERAALPPSGPKLGKPPVGSMPPPT